MKTTLFILILAFFTAVPVFAQDQAFQLSVEKEDMPYIQHYHEHTLGIEIYKAVEERDLEGLEMVSFNEAHRKVTLREWKNGICTKK